MNGVESEGDIIRFELIDEMAIGNSCSSASIFDVVTGMSKLCVNVYWAS